MFPAFLITCIGRFPAQRRRPRLHSLIFTQRVKHGFHSPAGGDHLTTLPISRRSVSLPLTLLTFFFTCHLLTASYYPLIHMLAASSATSMSLLREHRSTSLSTGPSRQLSRRHDKSRTLHRSPSPFGQGSCGAALHSVCPLPSFSHLRHCSPFPRPSLRPADVFPLPPVTALPRTIAQPLGGPARRAGRMPFLGAPASASLAAVARLSQQQWFLGCPLSANDFRHHPASPCPHHHRCYNKGSPLTACGPSQYPLPASPHGKWKM